MRSPWKKLDYLVLAGILLVLLIVPFFT